MLEEPRCYRRQCINFIGAKNTKNVKDRQTTVDGVLLVCKAFSIADGGIPNEIAYGKNLHLKPFPKDSGIQFEKAKSGREFVNR
ncbi:MAG TPA: hypothetical protein QF468_06340 [Nitrospinota bacterium]|jgi:hypothetical protein|nr:hypothetical protein [Nitrospinota bacterium]|tara:strand:- start:4137 stop:4388 length:252 start_codon:yes stop_codon:yes gene_type:complete